MADAQVRISNVGGQNARKVLAIKHSALLPYVERLIEESNTKYQPNNSAKYDHLPLLSVVDLADTQEEYVFGRDNLPTADVLNSKNKIILKIIPEDDSRDMYIYGS